MIQRRDKLRQRVEAGRGLQVLLFEDPPLVRSAPAVALVAVTRDPEPGPEPEPAAAPPPEPATFQLERGVPGAVEVQKSRGAWKRLIRDWVYGSGTGLSGADIRALIYKDRELSEKFSASDKGFYHALTRLQKSNEITRHLGRYYSPTSLDDYRRRVAAGEIVETQAPESASAYSPMAEAVLDLVSVAPGISGSDIVRILRSDVEFNAALTPHSTGAYNVIARLAKRRQIDRRGSDCFPGPNMTPRDPASKWLKQTGVTNDRIA